MANATNSLDFNEKLIRTISTIIREELKKFTDIIEHRNTKIAMEKWADTEFVPSLEKTVCTGLQLKDKISSRNKILVSIPASENQTANTISEKIKKVIDPDTSINSDIILGSEKIVPVNNDKPSAYVNYKLTLPSKEQLQVKGQTCIQTLFTNLTDFNEHADISKWRIATDTPLYARKHRRDLTHFAYLIRQSNQGKQKIATKLKFSVKEHRYYLQIKSQKSNNQWVNLEQNVSNIPNKLHSKYKDLNPVNYYQVQESERFYEIYNTYKSKKQ